ncbi:MAG: GntR family transcriptional regulator, partial [Anaerolineae bacterium]|nr:GntR family transcriptional regulator [Anaerolineae bacterium]
MVEAMGPRYALEHRSLGDAATERLRGLILSGGLRAGEHLVEADLAERMGVSRGPVREALARLEQEGFVDLVPRQGAFVVELTPELVQEKYELRRLLETYALGKGMTQIADSDLDELERSCAEMEQAVQLHDIQGFYQTQYRYHRAIVSLARMEMLLKIWDLLGASIGSLMMLNLYHGDNGAEYGPQAWQSDVATGTLTAHR